MKSISVRIKKAHPGILSPVYKTDGSAGCDIHASENVTIPVGETALVPTGLFVEVPEGFECQARPRSGLALNDSVTVFNSPGTVDSDFRGEMKILLVNHSKKPYEVVAGSRVAQLVFAPVMQAKFTVVDELSETPRGFGGWGSTGVS